MALAQFHATGHVSDISPPPNSTAVVRARERSSAVPHGASCGGKGRGVSSRKGAETNESQDASHLQRVEAGVRDGQPSLPAVA